MLGTLTLKSLSIVEIQRRFDALLLKSDITDSSVIPENLLREKMFAFLKSVEFRECYFELAMDAARAVGLGDREFVFQTLPTPRIFRPGKHGTSFHCDYWYGHGENSYTVWTPLSDIEPANTFLLCHDDNNEEIFERLVQSKGFIEVESEILKHTYPAMPPKGAAVVFPARTIHGSPRNESTKQRLSFDFRVGTTDDKTSTKDLFSYFQYRDGKFFIPERFKGLRYLKYVCGGHGKNTFAQQFIIEAAAKNYNINIVAQEAEIERLGYPMLEQYLSHAAYCKGFDAIILSSFTILDAPTVALARASQTPVYCVLENVTLNQK